MFYYVDMHHVCICVCVYTYLWFTLEAPWAVGLSKICI